MSASVSEINFFDPETNDCPYPAYHQLRDEAPVWKDPRPGCTSSPATRTSGRSCSTRSGTRTVSATARTTRARRSQADDPRRQALRAPSGSQKLYEEKGWVPAPSLDARDEPNHMQMRRLFDHAFRPSAIKRDRPVRRAARLRACRGLPRRRPVRVGGPARGAAAALRDRAPGRRAGRGPAADQGLDGRVDQADGADADRRGDARVGARRRSRRSTTSSQALRASCVASPTTRC